jgi:hypothetical protein
VKINPNYFTVFYFLSGYLHFISILERLKAVDFDLADEFRDIEHNVKKSREKGLENISQQLNHLEKFSTNVSFLFKKLNEMSQDFFTQVR